MNHAIGRIGAAIVATTVFLFAACMIVGFPFGSYLVCMFLPVGYIMMVAGLYCESRLERRAASMVGLALAIVYATLVLLVYFAQTTSVRLDDLNGQAARLLDFQRGGLLFNYDLLGYGMMALSTFFTGLSIEPEGRADRWLKRLMLIHGVFFIGCLVMPMTGAFAGMADGENGAGGTAALLGWCAYFLPVGVLAYGHFQRSGDHPGLRR